MIVSEITSGQWTVIAGLGTLLAAGLLAMAWLTWYCVFREVKKGEGRG